MARRSISKVGLYVLGAAVGCAVLLPFVWMVLTSFKPVAEIYSGTFLPRQPDLHAYRRVLRESLLVRWYLNSFIVSAASTLSVLALSSLSGFTITQLSFPGKNVIFFGILATMIIPEEMFIIPWYMMATSARLANSYAGLIIPRLLTVTSVFFMKQYMESIPRDLFEAGRIDGLSEFGLYRWIALPVVKPAVAAVGIITFLGTWNDFLWPLVLANRQEMFTLQVGLSLIGQTEAGVNPDFIMAGATLSVIPVLCVFVFFQKYIIKGISMTGFK